MNEDKFIKKLTGIHIAVAILIALLGANVILWANKHFMAAEDTAAHESNQVNSSIAEHSIKVAPTINAQTSSSTNSTASDTPTNQTTLPVKPALQRPILEQVTQAALNNKPSQLIKAAPNTQNTPTNNAALADKPAITALNTNTQCLSYGPVNFDDSQMFINQVLRLGLPKPELIASKHKVSHMIQIGPLLNQQTLDKKIAELKHLNINEFAIIDKYIISLGLFSTKEAAQIQLDSLKKQGSQTARIVRKNTTVSKYTMTLKNVSAEQYKVLQQTFTTINKLQPC